MAKYDNKGGRWVTISGRKVFIRTKNAQLKEKLIDKINNSIKKEEKSPTEHYIQLIVDDINSDYEKMSPEDREWANTFDKYLDVMGYNSSKDFKDDILWLARENDNQNFRWGKTNAFNYNLNDSGEIEDNGQLVSYRKAVTEAKKRIKYFNKYLNDDED